MRILYLIGREASYPRNDVILRAFRKFSDVEVIAGGDSGSLIWRSVRVFLRALPRLLARRYDLIFVGFYGHLIVIPVSWLAGAPVLFDAFVSNYDTLCFDRQLYSPNSFVGRLAFLLDTTACRTADRVLLDTQAHLEYFARTFNVPSAKMLALPVGCNEDLFYPKSTEEADGITKVLYYSTYLPLHGVDIVLKAADLLRDEKLLCFKIIGSGQEYPAIRRLAADLGLDNVIFESYLPIEQLPNEIARADICLGGHFGASAKAGRVIPGKIYQILAMARPLVAADTPANSALLSHGTTALLCPSEDAEGLAAAILEYHRNPELRGQIAENGRARFLEVASEAVIADRLSEIVRGLVEIT
jgi:glycosyltransferase involved in cell wall biosynthesis